MWRRDTPLGSNAFDSPLPRLLSKGKRHESLVAAGAIKVRVEDEAGAQVLWNLERPMRIELTPEPWQGSVLPLY